MYLVSSDIVNKDHSSSSLAWITTLQAFLLFMFGPIVGQLIDVYGARRISIPFSVLAIFAVCMFGLCTKYWQIMLTQGVAFGIASSCISLPALVLATQWLSSKRGLATGIFAASSSLGGVVYPSPAVRRAALMQSILLIIANVLVSIPFKQKGWQKKESAGL